MSEGLRGVLLASGSLRWTAAQKATACVFTAGSAGAGTILFLLAAAADSPVIGPVLALAVIVAGPLVAGGQLADGVSRRSAPRR